MYVYRYTHIFTWKWAYIHSQMWLHTYMSASIQTYIHAYNIYICSGEKKWGNDCLELFICFMYPLTVLAVFCHLACIWWDFSLASTKLHVYDIIIGPLTSCMMSSLPPKPIKEALTWIPKYTTWPDTTEATSLFCSGPQGTNAFSIILWQLQQLCYFTFSRINC